MTGGIFAILDDIAMLLDDAAVMGKVAAKKTAGILGDDLAVNAEKATGFRASRELPVVWAITKGSLINKLILLPLAFLLSAYASWLIVPILLVGGAYLSFEGVEKIYHACTHHSKGEKPAVTDLEEAELLRHEKNKIKSAIRTDFILSIEIVMIGLGTVMEHHLVLQILVVSSIALLATIGVYGFVALLVRMDDVGLYVVSLSRRLHGFVAWILRKGGMLLVAALPHVIRILAIIGTVAMLLVGGGMYTHNIKALHHVVERYPAILADFAVGFLVGLILLGLFLLIRKMRSILPVGSKSTEK